MTRSGALTMVYGQSSAQKYPRVDFSGIPPEPPFRCPCRSGTDVVLQSDTSAYTHASAIHHTTALGDYFSAANPDLEHVWIRGNLGPTKPGTAWTPVVGETKP